VVRSEQVASSVNTNPAVIRRIFSMLAQAGITTSQLGQGGGALLLKPALEITLLDVYKAVEEPQVLSTHRAPPDPNCVVGRHIIPVLHPHFQRAELALEAELSHVTIADIAASVARRGHVRFPLTN
jgi:DNA-binding IscR family transcriptional regulator